MCTGEGVGVCTGEVADPNGCGRLEWMEGSQVWCVHRAVDSTAHWTPRQEVGSSEPD